MRIKICVPQGKIALVYKKEQVFKVLEAGHYSFWGTKAQYQIKYCDLSKAVIDDAALIAQINTQPAIAPWVDTLTTNEGHIGLLRIDNKAVGLVPPGECIHVWKKAGTIEMELINCNKQSPLPTDLLQTLDLAKLNQASRLIQHNQRISVPPVYTVNIEAHQQGLLYIDGKLEQKLSPGRYGYWQLGKNISCEVYNMRSDMLEVSGQEILTRDKVSLRVNLNAEIQLIDIETIAVSIASPKEHVYKLLQLALREAIGTQNLDQLLEDKQAINKIVMELCHDKLAKLGIRLEQIGVKDIILPGDMKAILNQVVEAQKAAEANVIKRREETAATRSLHNTAKVMENNPTLLRLKELEALEKVADKIDTLNVYGGLEGVMNNLVKVA